MLYTLCLGSNLGNPRNNIREAMRHLRVCLGMPTAVSPITESEPWGYASDHRYANAAVTIESDLTPQQMLATTQQVERDMGRTSKSHDGRYEDRIIDIDIIAAGHHVVYDPDLRIPHPLMWQRPFVRTTLQGLRPTIADLSMPSPLADYTPRVATIGFFDGMHLGHRHLITQLTDLAEGHTLPPMVLTFDRHPHDVIHPDEPPVGLLTTADERQRQLQDIAPGAEMWTLHFTPHMAALTAREFMERVLRQQLNIGTLLIGYDHHFGHPLPGRRESFDDYVAYGRQIGIEVVRATELQAPFHVSSSTIRRAIAQARVGAAATMLGRPYRWQGTVVHGNQIGRQLGFPTANLQPLHPELITPPRGVYAAWAIVPEASAVPEASPSGSPALIPAMVNIGTRPTVAAAASTSPAAAAAATAVAAAVPEASPSGPSGPSGPASPSSPSSPSAPATTIEAHLIGFSGDIYSRTVTLDFVAHLRDEQRFPSEAALARQLRRDAAAAKRMLTSSQPRPRRSLGQLLSSALNSLASRAWVYIFIFIIGQMLGLLVLEGMFACDIYVGGPAMLAISVIVANLATIALVMLGAPPPRIATPSYFDDAVSRRFFQYLIAAPGVIIAVNIIQELLLFWLPDILGADRMAALLDEPFGIIAVCLLAPAAEELVFRGGVQGTLASRRHANAHRPVVIAAIAFAIIHINPAQMPAALIIGIYLGEAYRETGTLVTPMLIHAINNFMAAWLITFCPETATVAQLLGGTPQTIVAGVVAAAWAAGVHLAGRRND